MVNQVSLSNAGITFTNAVSSLLSFASPTAYITAGFDLNITAAGGPMLITTTDPLAGDMTITAAQLLEITSPFSIAVTSPTIELTAAASIALTCPLTGAITLAAPFGAVSITGGAASLLTTTVGVLTISTADPALGGIAITAALGLTMQAATDINMTAATITAEATSMTFTTLDANFTGGLNVTGEVSALAFTTGESQTGVTNSLDTNNGNTVSLATESGEAVAANFTAPAAELGEIVSGNINTGGIEALAIAAPVIVGVADENNHVITSINKHRAGYLTITTAEDHAIRGMHKICISNSNTIPSVDGEYEIWNTISSEQKIIIAFDWKNDFVEGTEGHLIHTPRIKKNNIKFKHPSYAEKYLGVYAKDTAQIRACGAFSTPAISIILIKPANLHGYVILTTSGPNGVKANQTITISGTNSIPSIDGTYTVYNTNSSTNQVVIPFVYNLPPYSMGHPQFINGNAGTLGGGSAFSYFILITTSSAFTVGSTVYINSPQSTPPITGGYTIMDAGAGSFISAYYALDIYVAVKCIPVAYVLDFFSYTGSASNTAPPLPSSNVSIYSAGDIAVSGKTFAQDINITGQSSGSITIQAINGTYNFIMPTSAGIAGQVLVSGGGLGTTENYWSSGPVFTTTTSITDSTASTSKTTGALTVTGGLGVGGAIYANNVVLTSALPVLSGGTGVTTSTGTGSVVLSSSPTLVTPALGAATGSTLTLTTSNPAFVASITGTSSTNIAQWFQASLATNSFVEALIGVASASTSLAVGYKNASTPYGFLGLGQGNITAQIFPTSTVSSSTTTGAVVVTGGLGVSGSVWGNTLNSSVATGTSPLTVASTTVVSNLNASLLGGATFASPGAIGGTTASTGAFTTLTASTASTSVPLTVTLTGTGNGNAGTFYEASLAVSNYVQLDVGISAALGLQIGYQNNASPFGFIGMDNDTPSVQFYTHNTQSTSVSTGSVVIVGGLGVGENICSSGVLLQGSSSGIVSVLPQAAAGTFNFNLPVTAGTSGYVLTSGGGGSSPMTWSSTSGFGSVSSVGLTVPSFLSVSGSPITTSGTLAVSLSGTALPVLNGGTGTTTSTGSGSVVLSTSPTLVSPALGAASATSLTLTIPLAIAQGGTGTTSGTGSGSVVFATSPTLVTPALGVATATGLTITGSNTAFATTINTATSSSIATFYASSLNTNAYTQINVGLSGSNDVNWGYNNSPTPYGYVSLNNGSSVAKFFASGTSSTSATTGAVVVTGGLGVSGSVWGNTLNSSVATGTAPFTVASTTVVSNLNASLLGGATFASPGNIGGTTAGTGAFTTLTASGASGTTPFSVNITGTGGTEAASFFQPSLAVNGFVQVNMGISSILDFNLGYINASTPYGFMALNDGIISVQVFTPTVSTSTTTGTMVITNGLGVSGNVSTAGLNLQGSSSGVVSVLPQAAAGTYNFNLPVTAGTSGYVLTSGGGGSSPMTWSSTSGFGSVSSVGLTVPSFLSVSGSPITTSGTLAVTLSGTALPVLNGGTGTTTSTGSGSVVLSTSPTLVTPALGAATGSTLTLTTSNPAFVASITGTSSTNIAQWFQASLATNSFVEALIGVASASTSLAVGYKNAATPYGFLGLGQGNITAQIFPTSTVSSSTTTGAVVVTGGLGVSGALYANNAVLTNALPVLSGGTGVTTSTGTGSVVLSSSPTLVTPALGAATGTTLTLSSSLNQTLAVVIGGTTNTYATTVLQASLAVNAYIENLTGVSLSACANLGYSNGTTPFSYWGLNQGGISAAVFARNTASTAYTNGTMIVNGGLGVNGAGNFNGPLSTNAVANNTFNYNYGSWTPGMTGSASSPSGLTYSAQTGQYVKIGASVTVNFWLGFSYTSAAISNNILINNLPYTPSYAGTGSCDVANSSITLASLPYSLYLNGSSISVYASGSPIVWTVGGRSSQTLQGSFTYLTTTVP